MIQKKHSKHTGTGLLAATGSVLTLSIVLMNAALVTLPSSAQAAIFKCVGADGEISYNQTPCAPAQETAKVLSVNSTQKADIDCRIANNFALQTATSMRAGRSSRQLFDSYGGIDAMPSTSIGVVNYVYSHKGNVTTGAQRITSLSAARCSGGSYGPVACDDFPYAFVAKLGGCDEAKRSTLTNQPINDRSLSNVSASNAPAGAANTQAMAARTADAARKENCKQNVRAQLSNLFVEMRVGQSAAAQSQLKVERDNLRDKLSSC